MSSDNLCSTCKLFPESQSHVLQCPVIVPRLKLIIDKPSQLEERYIYGNAEKQLQIIKIYSQIFEVRKELLDEII